MQILSECFGRQSPDNPNTLTSIQRDETIYSWCATNHAMCCGKSSAATGIRLLRSAHAMRQHDLPAALLSLPLVQDRGEVVVFDCLRAHTIAGYYLPFLSYADQNMVRTTVCAGDSQHWRRHVSGISRTRPVSHPLKWCHLCAERDEEAVGRAYWHVDLQFPTTWLCGLHHAALSSISNSGKRWLLPSASIECRSFAVEPSDVECASMLAAIGSSLRAIDSVDITSLRRSAIRRLCEIGVIHSPKGCHHGRIEKWFIGTRASSILRSPTVGLQYLAEGDWIPALLWRTKLTHAARWVALWASLEWMSPGQAAHAFEHAANGGLVHEGGQLGLFDLDQVPTMRAPAKVQDAFASSDSYAEVMARLLVSRSDVVRWLEQDPLLRSEWRQRLRAGRQSQCISRIREACSAANNLTRQRLEEVLGTEIQWLREHSPALLNEVLKSVPARASAQRQLFHDNDRPRHDGKRDGFQQ